jgi:hypothetical protein
MKEPLQEECSCNLETAIVHEKAGQTIDVQMKHPPCFDRLSTNGL